MFTMIQLGYQLVSNALILFKNENEGEVNYEYPRHVSSIRRLRSCGICHLLFTIRVRSDAGD